MPGITIISGDCHAALAVLRTVIAGDSALLLAGVNLRSLNSGDCHAALAVLRTVIAGDSALLLAGVNLRSLNSGDGHAALAVLRTVNVRGLPGSNLRGLFSCPQDYFSPRSYTGLLTRYLKMKHRVGNHF